MPDIKPKNGWIWLILLSVTILSGDFFTGRDIKFTTLYVLPVALSGWIQFKRMAYVLAILFPLVRLVFFIPWEAVHDLPMGVINAAIQAAVLTIMAFLAGRARGVTELKRQLKILHGILPICMLCKKIRNEKGEYEQLETFIHTRSEADFSHGYCPDCMKKVRAEYSHLFSPGREKR